MCSSCEEKQNCLKVTCWNTFLRGEDELMVQYPNIIKVNLARAFRLLFYRIVIQIVDVHEPSIVYFVCLSDDVYPEERSGGWRH